MSRVTSFHMLIRSLRAGNLPQRRHYVARKDIRFTIRDVSEPGALENARAVAMQPHPYSPMSSSLAQQSSQNYSSNISASPHPASALSRPATSSDEPNASSTDLTVIMSPNRVNANSSNDDQAPSRLWNPFDTHKVFKQLEKDFPSPIAHTLMRATRGLLMDRIAKAGREGVDVKEAENVSIPYSCHA